MANATVVSKTKKNHNKQTYLSKEDRILIIALVQKEVEQIMSAKLTPASIQRVASMQDLIDKCNAKMNA